MWILKKAIETIALRDHGENNIPSYGVLVYISDEVPSSTAEAEKWGESDLQNGARTHEVDL